MRLPLKKSTASASTLTTRFLSTLRGNTQSQWNVAENDILFFSKSHIYAIIKKDFR